MSAKRAKFRVGQVVAYRRADEAAYRYGRIHACNGLCLESDGSWATGWRVLDGVRFENCNGSRVRPLTRREKGDAR